MTDFFAGWDERRTAHTRPAGDPAPPPAAPADPDRATRYAYAALEGEVANIQAVPIGEGRNDQLNKSALKMYGYVEAGAIDERTVTETLGAADGGLDYPATRRTLQSAREAARKYGARGIPAPTYPTATEDVPPWMVSSDPFSPYFRAAIDAREHAEPTASSSSPHTGTTSPSSPDSTPSSTAPALPTSGGAESDSDALVKLEAGKLRIRRAAARLVDNEAAVAAFRPPPFLPTLTDELAIPDEPISYRVDELIPSGGNVLLAAQFKAGKTTLMANLTRSLVDGDPFLGRYAVDRPDGRVVIFNYEVSRAQFKRWLRDVGITETGRVNVLPLRGFRLPLLVPHIEDWTVEYLKRAEAAVWIVDPFARAAVGSVTNENDNTEVGAFLDALDVIKERAGVAELVLPTHTGRADHEPGDERARGATRLDDWADVRWLLTRDKSDGRYFRATGRDVDVDEQALAYDDRTRRLTVTGGDRISAEHRRIEHAVKCHLAVNAGAGLKEIRDAVRDQLRTCSNDKIDAAIGRLHNRHEITIDKGRPGQATRHTLAVVFDPFGPP